MICQRCKKKKEGNFRKRIFIENGEPVAKIICGDCFQEILEKVGETRDEKELLRGYQSKGDYQL